MSLTVNSLSSNINTTKAVNQNNITFTGSAWKKEYDALMKALKAAKTDAEKSDIAEKLKDLSERAKKASETRVKNSKFETKMDNSIENFFGGVVKFANKLTKKITKKIDSGDAVDMAKKVTSIVLLGNTAKEVVGTALYTIQALTNEDLPEEKRKFVGMYDLFVGAVSSTISLLFGIVLQDPIAKGYNKLFKPLKKMPRIRLITTALAGFTAFALQTIVGKRIIAPAIATPTAGKVKQNMIAKDEAKRNNASAVENRA